MGSSSSSRRKYSTINPSHSSSNNSTSTKGPQFFMANPYDSSLTSTKGLSPTQQGSDSFNSTSTKGIETSSTSPKASDSSNSTSTETSILPDPFHLAHAIPNIKSLIPVHLDLDINHPNYQKWSQSFNFTVNLFSLTDVLHGKPRPPNISIEDWERADVLLKSWIHATISKYLSTMISSETASAHDLLTSLASLFNNLAIQLKENFNSLKLGYLSTSAYCQAIESAADKLADAGHPLSDEQLVLQTLRGLPEQYETFANFISFQDPLPTFSQLQSLLFNEETRLIANTSWEFKEKLKLGVQGKDQAKKHYRAMV